MPGSLLLTMFFTVNKQVISHREPTPNRESESDRRMYHRAITICTIEGQGLHEIIHGEGSLAWR